MIRIAVTMLGLSAWLGLTLGLRAYFGGREYLAKILGSDALADEALTALLDRPEAQLLGMDPWTVLLAMGVMVSAGLVLVVLAPVDLLLRVRGTSTIVRAVVGAGLAIVATGVVLGSIHPLLSMPTVPEGPRTVINYACEAIGYGWVNTIAYVGAIGAGVGLMAWRVPRADTMGPDDEAAEHELPTST